MRIFQNGKELKALQAFLNEIHYCRKTENNIKLAKLLHKLDDYCLAKTKKEQKIALLNLINND